MYQNKVHRTLGVFPSTYIYSYKFPNFFSDCVLLNKQGEKVKT